MSAAPHCQAQSCGAARRNDDELDVRLDITITGVLSDPPVYPDSRPDCQPGRSKVRAPTGQQHHCSPGSHRPALRKVLKQ